MRYSKEIIITSVLIILNVILVLTNNYICSYYALGKGYKWEANASTTNGLPIMFAKCELQYSGHYENTFDKNIMLRGDISSHTIDYISCGNSGLTSLSCPALR